VDGVVEEGTDDVVEIVVVVAELVVSVEPLDESSSVP